MDGRMDGKVVGRVVGGRWEGSGKMNGRMEWKVVGGWWEGGLEGGGRIVGRVGVAVGFLSSCHGDLRDWLVFYCLREVRSLFKLQGARRDSSRVAAGELREPLVLPQGSQVSIQVARASTGVLWSHGRGIRPQFAWKGEPQGVSQVAEGSVVSLKLPRGPEGASHVVSRKSGILSSCEGPLGIPL